MVVTAFLVLCACCFLGVAVVGFSGVRASFVGFAVVGFGLVAYMTLYRVYAYSVPSHFGLEVSFEYTHSQLAFHCV
jgi:hypothetical protein